MPSACLFLPDKLQYKPKSKTAHPGVVRRLGHKTTITQACVDVLEVKREGERR